ncbi:prepilin-type N-terminal cleavage/methylation domain-containing protein [Candidatus Nomurabacteria bacterium]|nr:prepilin-type N-terminal cleavage/methylation domain-containing protein [Candidatus Nomurabacteria bacterium]
MILKRKNNQKAFSLIETLVYIFITAMLLTTISSLIMANFNIRKKLKTSDLVYNDARFIMNQVSNKIHSVNVFDDVRPDSEQIIFYSEAGEDFVFVVEDNNLIYREIPNVGGGQALENVLNSERVEVNNFILTPVSDWQGNLNKGILINFNLSIGAPEDVYNYLNQDFETFISIR